MQRVHYSDNHRAFAELVRGFATKDVAPYIQGWENDGLIPRGVFAKAGSESMREIIGRDLRLDTKHAADA